MGSNVSEGGDDARRHSDDVVRRLRDDSARRVDWERRRGSFSSWCALATLAGGISIVALNAQEARFADQEAIRAAAERDARVAAACAERSARITATRQDMIQKLTLAKTEEERERIRAEAVARKVAAMQLAADKGCGPSVTPQPAWIPEMPKSTSVAPPKPHYRRGDRCGGDPPYPYLY